MALTSRNRRCLVWIRAPDRTSIADESVEILAENQLSALIPPSLRYILAVATHRRPRYLLRVLNSFDELYAVLALLVERYYLKTYGGGFTEYFYGLKRERVLAIKGGEAPRARLGAPEILRETLQLKNRDIWKNLAVIIGIPYVKRKLDESFDIHVPQATIIGQRFNRNDLPHDATIRPRILHYYKWFLRKIYPSLNAAYYFSLLLFNLAYLFDNTKYSSPFLWLIGTRLRRLNLADHKAIALAEASTSNRTTRSRSRGRGANSIFQPSTISTAALGGLKLLLPTSIFALKFLEWYHASDFARQLSKRATDGLDLPPPILPSSPNSQPHHQPSTIPAQSSPSDIHPQSTKPASTVALSSPPTDSSQTSPPTTQPRRPRPPISLTSSLPIYTISSPIPSTSSLCPICLGSIVTPTAAGTGFVYCYTCIFKWVEGRCERQVAFMAGELGGEGGWDDESTEGDDIKEPEHEGGGGGTGGKSRQGKWESGKGRCAVTGRRVLAGTDGLRRVMV